MCNQIPKCHIYSAQISKEISEIDFLFTRKYFFLSGGIVSPPDGTSFIYLPGSNGTIVWIFDNVLLPSTTRSWFFTSSKGGLNKAIATIVGTGTVPAFISPGYKIEGNGTLIINNVDESDNGTYTFALGLSLSNVVVFIASKCLRNFAFKYIKNLFTCFVKYEK